MNKNNKQTRTIKAVVVSLAAEPNAHQIKMN